MWTTYKKSKFPSPDKEWRNSESKRIGQRVKKKRGRQRISGSVRADDAMHNGEYSC